MKKQIFLLCALVAAVTNAYSLTIDDIKGEWSSNTFSIDTEGEDFSIQMMISLSLNEISGVCYAQDSQADILGYQVSVTTFTSGGGKAAVADDKIVIAIEEWENEYDDDFTSVDFSDSNNHSYNDGKEVADQLGAVLEKELAFPTTFVLENVKLRGDVMYATWGNGYKLRFHRK